MKQLVLKLDVNDEQVLNIAQGRIARISGNYKINMNKTTKLCTVTGDDIDPIEIVRKLRLLCRVDIVAVETPKEPEKKKEELVEEVVNASSRAAAVGPSKEPKKEDELRKEEPTKLEELVEEVVNASSLAAAVKLPSFGARQMTKAVLKLDLHDDKAKKKAMKTVSSLTGVDSISMDMKDKKLTVMGDIDAFVILAKLRKLCHTDIISVGPAKEPEKKKEEPKKPEADKWVKAYQASNPYLTTQYHVRSVEEDPNACVTSELELQRNEF